MKKYLIFLSLITSITCAQTSQPFSEEEQLTQLRYVELYYKQQNKPVPQNVVTGIQQLEKKYPNTKEPAAIYKPDSVTKTETNKPATKIICKSVKTKSNKTVKKCQTVKIRKKYSGKPIPSK